MGLDGIIPFLQNEYKIPHVISRCCPTYEMHKSRQDALRVLKHNHKLLSAEPGTVPIPPSRDTKLVERSIVTAPHEYVTVTYDDTKREDELKIHVDPDCKLVIIRDLMTDLRRPRHIRADRSGIHFYAGLIEPVRRFARERNVRIIVLLVDKDRIPEKFETQEKRKRATQRSKANKARSRSPRKKDGKKKSRRKKADSDNEGSGRRGRKKTDSDNESSERKGRKERREDSERDRERREDSEGRKERREDAEGHKERGEEKYPVEHEEKKEPSLQPVTESDALPDDIIITDAGVFVPGTNKVIPLDACQIMNQTPLRTTLYRYLLNCLVNDEALLAGGTTVVFEFETTGPWVITSERAQRVEEYSNPIGEADLACFWWATHQPNYDVFIFGGDTDYLVIALMNAHRFRRTLLIQIRDDAHVGSPTRPLDPVCMEAHHTHKMLRRLGTHPLEFAVGCIINGTDFVNRSLLVCGLGPETVMDGVRLYGRLRHQLATVTERSHGTSQSRIHQDITGIMRNVFLGAGFVWGPEALPESAIPWPTTMMAGADPLVGLDAVLCMIYLVYHRAPKAKSQTMMIGVASEGRVVVPKTMDAACIDRLIVDFFRPLLTLLKENKKGYRADMDPKQIAATGLDGKMYLKTVLFPHARGLPPWDNEAYQHALARILFNFKYWQSLQNTLDP